MAYKKYKELLNGRRFGHWEILRRVPSRRCGISYVAYYEAKCDCGTIREVRATSLRRGLSRSCGCIGDQYLPKGDSARNALFCSYRYGARTRNLLWEVSKEQFKEITARNCFYCGSPPRPMMASQNRRGPCDLNGIDRVESSKGYVLSNCVPCCSDCNIMKSDKSIEDFLSHVEKIYNHSKEN
jgi:hypothetical protein